MVGNSQADKCLRGFVSMTDTASLDRSIPTLTLGVHYSVHCRSMVYIGGVCGNLLRSGFAAAIVRTLGRWSQRTTVSAAMRSVVLRMGRTGTGWGCRAFTCGPVRLSVLLSYVMTVLLGGACTVKPLLMVWNVLPLRHLWPATSIHIPVLRLHPSSFRTSISQEQSHRID